MQVGDREFEMVARALLDLFGKDAPEGRFAGAFSMDFAVGEMSPALHGRKCAALAREETTETD